MKHVSFSGKFELDISRVTDGHTHVKLSDNLIDSKIYKYSGPGTG